MLSSDIAQKNHDSRCAASAKSGKRCRAAATAGGLCFFHANPKKASELGRIGGRKKCRAAEVVDSLPVLDSAVAVRDTLEQLIADVHAGKVPPKVAASLAALMNLHLRAIETAGLEQRVERLELLLEQVKHYKHLDSKMETVRLRVDELQFLVRQMPRKPILEQGTEASSVADSLNINKS